MIVVKEKELVVPGTLLAEGDYLAEMGTYKKENKIYASVTGLCYITRNRIKIVSLKGKYIPKFGDSIIGMVVSERGNGWQLEMNSPYKAHLSSKDIFQKRYFPIRIGDLIHAKIIGVSSLFETTLNARRPYGRLEDGNIVEIHASRVPRLIGRKGSMINIIKNETRCKLIVGQNGWIYVKGSPRMEKLARLAIEKVDKEAHIPGLTDRISEFLKEER
ncbi:MAG: exosome complex RNA-binding protein Rrp4 [Candidatus Methanofastidiosia archaeon]